MKIRITTLLAIALAIACIAHASPSAHAASATMGFMSIPENTSSSAYGLKVSNQSLLNGILGSNQVAFLFTNTGSSSIVGVYFEDNNILGAPTVNNGPGVMLHPHDVPQSLPGGAPYGFGTPTKSFHAFAVPGGSNTGVHEGQWLEIVFTLQSGNTIHDVFDAIAIGLNDPFATGGMLIGLHAIDGADSGSYVFESMNVIPLPAAAWIGLAGLGVVAVSRRSLRQR